MTTRRSHRFGFGPSCGWVLALALGGCESPQTPAGTAPEATSGIAAPSAVDVRTEATIIEMENRYIAEKNSQPTHQHEAEAKAAEQKAAEQKAAKEKAALAEKEKAQQQPEAPPATAPK